MGPTEVAWVSRGRNVAKTGCIVTDSHRSRLAFLSQLNGRRRLSGIERQRGGTIISGLPREKQSETVAMPREGPDDPKTPAKKRRMMREYMLRAAWASSAGKKQ